MKAIQNTLWLLILINYWSTLTAQNEFSKWYFGQQAGLDFSTSPPTVLTNGMIFTVEGVATISDASGNLLFYTDGLTIFNSNHVTMANGTGLAGHGSSTQSAIIVKQPGNSSIYYIFTTWPVNGIKYSIVDMSLAAGLGSVTVKNATLNASTCEKQVAVRHCNGKDVWVVSHDNNSNQFRTFLLTNSGLTSIPVISSIGEPINNLAGVIGHLKGSPDRRHLAMATGSTSTPSSLGMGGFFLFDFDPSSGTVSNSLTLMSCSNVQAQPYGMEFSPDGTKLYGTTAGMVNVNDTCALYQWNVCAASPSAIVNSVYAIGLGTVSAGSVQWAKDGKLYIAHNTQSLSVINNPNASGAAMNFVKYGLSVAPKTSRLGLPNYIHEYIKPAPLPFTNTVACQTSSFSVPSVPTSSGACSSFSYAPAGYLWDFGEPASGSANTSSLSKPVHIYSATGTYTASLILLGPCANDTLKQVITITTPGPNPNVTGTFTFCKGESKTYTVSGGNSYLWSNNAGGVTTTTAVLNPTQTTAYSVSATTNGCTLAKSFTVTVNPCLGINALGDNSGVRIFPNPVRDLLMIETDAEGDFTIFDMSGRIVLDGKLSVGKNEISMIELPTGVYSFNLINEKNTLRLGRGKLVIIK